MASVELIRIDPDLPQLRPALIFGDGAPLGHEVTSAKACDVEWQLHFLREAVKSLNRSSRGDDSIIAESINGSFMQQTLELNEDHVFLTGIRIVPWLARAKDADLKAFCDWNIARHKQQQRALEFVTPELKLVSKERIDLLISLGYLPTEAREIYERAIDAAKLYALDSFEAGGELSNGYYTEKPEPRIGIANLFRVPGSFEVASPDMRRTTFHEHWHGGTATTNIGFLGGIATVSASQEELSWLEEAFAEHATVVSSNAADPKPEVIDPLVRADTFQNAYQAERRMLGLVMQAGPRPVSVADISAAFFEPLGTRRRARQNLENRLTANFAAVFPEKGKAAMRDFSTYYAGRSLVGRTKFTSLVARRIADRLGITNQS